MVDVEHEEQQMEIMTSLGFVYVGTINDAYLEEMEHCRFDRYPDDWEPDDPYRPL